MFHIKKISFNYLCSSTNRMMYGSCNLNVILEALTFYHLLSGYLIAL